MDLFHEMIVAGVEPIDTTLVSVLSTCLGRWIYAHFCIFMRIEVSSVQSCEMDL